MATFRFGWALALAALSPLLLPTTGHALSFSSSVQRFEADGNGYGSADGVFDLVDEFDDGVLAPNWHVLLGSARRRRRARASTRRRRSSRSSTRSASGRSSPSRGTCSSPRERLPPSTRRTAGKRRRHVLAARHLLRGAVRCAGSVLRPARRVVRLAHDVQVREPQRRALSRVTTLLRLGERPQAGQVQGRPRAAGQDQVLPHRGWRERPPGAGDGGCPPRARAGMGRPERAGLRRGELLVRRLTGSGHL
jgi:hypothetical protein